MTTYFYKAARPDGRDFYTGTIDWSCIGEVVTHPNPNLSAGADRYLSVATVPTDCTGMRWPCRLFEVRPVGCIRQDDYYTHKRCGKAFLVVRELPATDALGPQGVEVAALIERCSTLTPDEAERLYEAWGAARRGAARRGAARGAGLYAALGAALGAARLDAALDAVWDAARAAAVRDAARYAALDAVWDAVWDAARAPARAAAVRDAAWAAARDAILAILDRDLITPEWHDLLTGPWRSVIGVAA